MNSKLWKSALTGLLALSLAACGGTADSSTAPAESSQEAAAPAAEASGKDTLTVALGAQFTTLDPALNTETVNSNVLSHIYSGLFRTDTSKESQPELCESYEVSDDGLTYTFHLRDGITWSDGSPITSNDFVYSYLREHSPMVQIMPGQSMI